MLTFAAMLAYAAVLLAAAIMLLGLQPRREANRWAAGLLLAASLGGMAGALRERMPDDGSGWLQLAELLLRLANHTLTPYAALLFALAYTRSYSAAVRARLKLLLLLPAAVTAAAFPLMPDERFFYVALLIWVGPYYAAACWRLLAAAFAERIARRRKERFAVAALFVPTLLAALLLINVANVWEPGFGFFGYIVGFIAYSLLLGAVSLFGSGLLGVKVRIERDPLESAVSAARTGTAMLGHTIKNEVAKIAMSAENVKAAIGPSQREAVEQLDVIVRAAEHMRQMVTRIHGQMEELVLERRPCRLRELAESGLQGWSERLDRRGVGVRREWQADPMVSGDPVHLREAMNNLIANAWEAMPEGGRLTVRLEATKRSVELSFHDTGCGMTRDRLERVLEPFYTTKQGQGNFGLGLTYVYKVMQQGGGDIVIDSEPGAGTTVTLRFPSTALGAASPSDWQPAR